MGKATGMNKKTLHQKINELANLLFNSDLSDLQVLAQIHSLLEEIESYANENSDTYLSSVTATAIELIEQIILDEIEDPAASLETLRTTVESIQKLYCDESQSDQNDPAQEITVEEQSIPSDKTNHIPPNIDQLTDWIFAMDSADPKMLADIHTVFEEIEQWAQKQEFQNTTQLIQKLKEWLEELILNENADSTSVIQTIQQSFEELKQSILEKRDIQFGALPRELGLTSDQPDTSQTQSIEDIIDQLSEMLILSDLSDLRIIAEMHTHFEEIAKWAAETNNQKIETAVQSMSGLIESYILDELNDKEKTIDLLNRTVSVLQSTICEGRTDSEFPSELQTSDETIQTEKTTEGTQKTIDQPGVKSSLYLPAGVDETLFADFLARQTSALDDIEECFLEFEKTNDEKHLKSIKGLLHTLKGEAGMLGLTEIERLCHATEDMLNRDTPEQLIDILFEVKDWLSQTFDAYSGKATAPNPVDSILSQIQEMEKVPPEEIELVQPEVLPIGPNPLEGDLGLLSDFIHESLEHLDSANEHLLTLETEPHNSEALNAVFRAFHTIKGVAGCLELIEIRSLAHEAESLLDQARKGELQLKDDAIDITFSSVDTLKTLIEQLSNSLSTGIPPTPDSSVPQLISKLQSLTQPQKSKRKSTKEKSIDHIPISRKSESTIPAKESEAEVSLPDQESLQSTNLQQAKEAFQKSFEEDAPAKTPPVAAPASTSSQLVKVKEIVKVDADRLDHLVETIGELVIAFSMVKQAAEQKIGKSQHFDRQLRQLDKITRELQGMGTSLRMIPIRATFQKMARLVRDLSKKIEKPIEFVMSGEDTELDKAVVDKIGDPLVHMVRNAVDHGIESRKEDRIKAGKNEIGRVELRAFHKGGNICIEIEDDGRGLDREAILSKSRDRGLIKDGENLSDREVFNLIFEPGFSTAKKVTEVSGRGVGMDVVKRNIEALRGQVDIRSDTGKGSIFTIRLPLTLAIIDGMIVRVGGERYIIPTLSIVQSLQPEKKDISTVLHKGEMLSILGRLIPIFRLSQLFEHKEAIQDPTKGLIVVVEDNENLAGLLVDELLGQQQIVIKSIGEVFRDIPGISGGAILADGRVGLILDIGGLVKLAHTNFDPSQ